MNDGTDCQHLYNLEIARNSFTTCTTRPNGTPWTAAIAGARGGHEFPKPLTDAERLTFALAASGLRLRHAVLRGVGMSRQDAQEALKKLLKREQRCGGKVLPYVGCVARSEDGDGYHVHLLIFRYCHGARFKAHARAVGFGRAWITQVPSFADKPGVAVKMISYVLGQRESVFGSHHHERHGERDRGAHRLLYPKRATLRRDCPELLAALKAATDQWLSDRELCARLPSLVSYVERGRSVEVVGRPSKGSSERRSHGPIATGPGGGFGPALGHLQVYGSRADRRQMIRSLRNRALLRFVPLVAVALLLAVVAGCGGSGNTSDSSDRQAQSVRPKPPAAAITMANRINSYCARSGLTVAQAALAAAQYLPPEEADREIAQARDTMATMQRDCAAQEIEQYHGAGGLVLAGRYVKATQ